MKLRTKIFVVLLLATSVYAQTEITKDKLDSLYNRFLQSKNMKNIKLATPSLVDDDADRKCSFGLAAEVRYYINQFTQEQQNVLNKLMSRPDLQTSLVSKSGKFRIHYDATGSNIPAYVASLSAKENAQLVADAFDSSYSFEVVYLKYPAPPADNGLGGDDLYDVYLYNLGDGNYGGTTPETAIGGGKYLSYIDIDNDFSISENFYTTGINAARVTAAHEFHHAIQVGNYIYKDEDLYFFEMTSTAMEEFVYDDVNDYYAYLKSFFAIPAVSFSYYEKVNSKSIYGQGLWNIFLHEKHDDLAFDMIKRQWELFTQTKALNAISTSLSENQISFKQALNEFGVWCYLTGYRKSPDTEGYSFSEGKNYPLLKPNFSTEFSSPEDNYQITTKPMANNYVKILSDNGVYMDTIVAIITNGDLYNGLTSPNSDFQYNLDIYNYEASGSVHIANNYYCKLTTPNDDYYLQSEIFNNKLAHDDTTIFTTADFIFPNPFRYSKQGSIYFPVEYNEDKIANLYIYSVDMNLVYSKTEKIQTQYDKFVLSWDGLDNNEKKLPTGVYIYISNSADKLKKGKLVIYND